MRLSLSALATLAFVSASFAGNCGYVTHSNYSYNYVAPQYVAPLVYIDPYVNVVAKAFLVPTSPYANAAAFGIPLQSYTSVAEDARSYFALKDAIRVGLKEAIQDLQNQQSQQPPNSPPQPGQPQQPNQPNALAPVPARQWQSVVVSAFRNNCATCHNPQSHPERLDLTGNADLNSYDSRFYDSVNEQRHDMLLRVTADEKSKEFMPKGGERVKPEELEAVWVAASVSSQEAKASRAGRKSLPPVPSVPKDPSVPKSPTPTPPVAGPGPAPAGKK